MEGWIKLHRQIIESPVFAHPTALKIWIWFLCKANHVERTIQLNVGQGFTTVKLLPGQFVFGRHKAEEDLGIDGSTIYKWLKKFETELSMISIESNNKFSIVTILKFKEFQLEESGKVATKRQQRSSKGTTEEQQRSTDKNDYNDKNVKNNIGADMSATLEQRSSYLLNKLEQYIGEYGDKMIQDFHEYWTQKNENGKKMLYEKQEIFDIPKRLKTWSNNSFNRKPNFGFKSHTPDFI